MRQFPKLLTESRFEKKWGQELQLFMDDLLIFCADDLTESIQCHINK